MSFPHLRAALLVVHVTGCALGVAACGDDDPSSTGDGSAPSGTAATTAGQGGKAPSSTGGAGGSGGSGDGGSSGSGGTAPGDAPTHPVDYVASTETLLNPERGFYSTTDLLDEDDLGWVVENGHTLVYSYVLLDEHRDEPLPDDLLQAVDASMALVREAGIKLVLRFAYNLGPYPEPDPDAPLDRVLEHIEQLAPVLDANQDVIAVVQAGFVGAWGEWHSSTNGLDEPDARAAIVEALLDAVPADRAVLLRNPVHKQAIFGEALDATEAWSGSDEARVGHHNDCFLASDTDLGTYPEDAVETWKDYVAADTLYVPMGGETCAPNPPRSECASALEEMERLHFTFLNEDYHPDVIDGWVDGGCKDELDRRLGYRLVLASAELPDAVRPGGRFVLRLRLRNDGFAAPINPRPLRVVLSSGGARHEVELPGIDARHLLGGAETEVAVRLQLPADLAEGPAALSLWLPDPDLPGDPRQAIRLANEATWEAATGDNLLGTITVDDGAAGAASPDAASMTAEPVP